MHYTKQIYAIATAAMISVSSLAGCSCTANTADSGESRHSTSAAENSSVAADINSSATDSQTDSVNTCSSIKLGDNTLTATFSGSYMLVNSESTSLNYCSITDDSGDKVVIFCNDGKLSFQKGSESITSFTYDGKEISLSDDLVYYDGTKLVYTDTSFCKYEIETGFTLECVSTGNYIFRTKDNITLNMLTVKDDSGNDVEFVVSRDGITATDSDGKKLTSFTINGAKMEIKNGNVVVDGEVMVPPDYSDVSVAVKKTNVTTVTTTTTAKKKGTTAKTEKATTTKKSAEATKKSAETKKATTTKKTAQVTTQKVTTTAKAVTTKVYTTRKVTTTTKKATAQKLSTETKEMLSLINAYRTKNGKSTLKGLTILDNAAQIRANELLHKYSHTRPNGKSCDTVLDELGINWMHTRENICYGVPGMSTVKEAFDAWINSAAHRANILSDDITYMAVAKATTVNAGQVTTFWAQIFLGY